MTSPLPGSPEPYSWVQTYIFNYLRGRLHLDLPQAPHSHHGPTLGSHFYPQLQSSSCNTPIAPLAPSQKPGNHSELLFCNQDHQVPGRLRLEISPGSPGHAPTSAFCRITSKVKAICDLGLPTQSLALLSLSTRPGAHTPVPEGSLNYLRFPELTPLFCVNISAPELLWRFLSGMAFW